MRYPGPSTSYESSDALHVPSVSALVAAIGSVLNVRASTIRLRVKDVVVLIEVDIDLGAVIFGDLYLVVALLILELGAGHAPVYMLERYALGLLHSGSG